MILLIIAFAISLFHGATWIVYRWRLKAYMARYNAYLNDFEKYKETIPDWQRAWDDYSDFVRYKCLFTEKEPSKPCDYQFLVLLIGGFGLVILLGMNFGNAYTHEKAMWKSTMYQEMVDNSSNELIATNGYADIVEYNSTIWTCRRNQDHWLWKSHYLWSGDWNDAPLVSFDANRGNTE